jgi:hypothetical protein
MPYRGSSFGTASPGTFSGKTRARRFIKRLPVKVGTFPSIVTPKRLASGQAEDQVDRQ